MAQNMVNYKKIFSAEAITKGTSVYATPIIDLQDWRPEGYFGLQVYLTGGGTLKLEWFISADGKNFLCPTGYDNVIINGFTKSSGSHGIEYGDTVLIGGVSGMTEINGLTGSITGIAAGTATTDINSAAFTAYTSGGTARPVRDPDVAADADAVITGISKAAAAVLTLDRGRDWFRITIPAAPYLKIKATETVGSSDIALSAWLVGV